MNDDVTLKDGSWIKTVEEEWGVRPVSCKVDDDRMTVTALFSSPLKVSGYMRIQGFTIVPQTITHHADHPFNAERNAKTGIRTHRTQLQRVL